MILMVAVFKPLRKTFAYLPDDSSKNQSLMVGRRVRISFNQREQIGIIVDVVKTVAVSHEKLKPIIELIDESPILDQEILKLCHFSADYYHAPIGEVLAAAVPKLLRQGKKPVLKEKSLHASKAPFEIQLTEEQAAAVEVISIGIERFGVFLLEGVTGSGKTEVYLQVIAKILDAGGQALVLVPEISLTPQTVKRFQERFQVPIVCLHSDEGDAKRTQSYLAAQSGHAKIVIGTRSAVFTSFKNLKLIIVDEEHDASFKQQSGFRYHARNLSIIRARNLKIPVVLGSATPSLESFLNVQLKRYQHVVLSSRVHQKTLPEVKLIDVSKSQDVSLLSKTMQDAIGEHLKRGEQVLIFLNRRGFAPILYCVSCQHTMTCIHCASRLVYHRTNNMICHICEKRYRVPDRCPQCGICELQQVGAGTQKIEEVLATIFKDIPIVRIDRDSTRRKGQLQGLLQKMHDVTPAILLGTQMIAKGHHFPHVTLTCILEIDTGFLSADFRAAEQSGQLLIQVAGRCGREFKKGHVMIQTRFPELPLLQTLLQHGYRAFAEQLLVMRRSALLPPYIAHALIRAEHKHDDKAQQFLEKIKDLSQASDTRMSIFGPYAPILAKKKGQHVKHLLIAGQRKSLQEHLQQLVPRLEKQCERVQFVIDVDPLDV